MNFFPKLPLLLTEVQILIKKLKLQDLYDASTPEVRKWKHDNIHLWKEKTPSV